MTFAFNMSKEAQDNKRNSQQINTQKGNLMGSMIVKLQDFYCSKDKLIDPYLSENISV